ncbi:hypothetical protein [Magnetovibrio blakemorei]|uniref:Uncharacterized protein n=1 Tax=Magnetovibrio blakemorei TaxID=28181 RepID=A0A1E5Q428_9PROT|nr:hypothetical protein [Magnetovibrio blakemorei]OEJ64659.1 hypothetical protein BEN30_00780 [Magnetovibrio blakemorei]
MSGIKVAAIITLKRVEKGHWYFAFEVAGNIMFSGSSTSKKKALAALLRMGRPDYLPASGTVFLSAEVMASYMECLAWEFDQ